MTFTNTKIFSAVLAIMAFAITQSVIIGGQTAGASVKDNTDTNYHEAYIDEVITHVQTWPTVGVQDSSIAVGDTVSVPVTLSDSPSGLSGYFVEISVSDSDIAQLSGVEFPDFGMTSNVETSEYSMKIAAVDLFNLIENGDENSILATVNIVGMARGTSSVTVSVLKMDDDEGNRIVTQTTSGVVSVY